ncbi:hypothetical protein Nepgr_008448 [Nepenthes gracilis]|uniref:DUF4378 domain-containing protein n=1 Tax=Nepenthes gracilis TaxID=150966 RepID=A0AAD3S8Y6_NEPGR|nr:hypothetical protein Nepgr_008448 [Nepenthes gracilis]
MLNFGLEAPRNSLELPAETFLPYNAIGEYARYSNEVNQEVSKTKPHRTDASMKKLISGEISKKSNKRQNAPSVVARLMGMDILSSDTESEIQPLKKNEKIGVNNCKEKRTEKTSTSHVLKKSNSSNEKDLQSYHGYKDTYSDKRMMGTKFKKPQPRIHPQEKQLQKFKKEFEASQAARFLECARQVELSKIPEQWLAQLDLTKEKMAFYENSRRAAIENAEEHRSDMCKLRSLSRDGFYDDEDKPFPAKHKEPYPLKNKSSGKWFEQLSLMDSDKKYDKYLSPKRIVILKPGPDSFSSNDESWVSSSGSLEDRGSIEDLLEEVKERLKSEMRGKTFKKDTKNRGGIETSFKEKQSNSKQITQHIARQVRENVTRDLGVNLLRSESTRSYTSEIQGNEPHSPDAISRGTRKILSERLRNVLNGENCLNFPNIPHSRSRPPVFDNVRGQLEQARNILIAESGRNYWNGVHHNAQEQARSFRHQLDNEGIIQEECSPRNLVRSFSAPVSGTSFGKLLLEDRHVSMGAHIRRKHEALENVSMFAKNRKKDRFNFREKVSNIRYSFTLKGKLFSRKFQSAEASQRNKFDLMDEITRVPTVMMNYSDSHENSTEVPPSPASVCSSVHEEFWKAVDHPSPLSTSDVTSVGDHSVGHVFKEISSNLHELRRQLNSLDYDGSEATTITEEPHPQLDYDRSEVTTVAEEPSEAEVIDLEDEAEAYIRDLLVASGLYNGSSDKSFSRWDSYAKPISCRVFEKVEESCNKSYEENVEPTKGHHERRVQHRLLFDLLNEALSTVLRPPMTSSRFRRKMTNSSTLLLPRGRKLLKKVWEFIREYLHPSTDKPCYSLEGIVAHDLGSQPWTSMIDGEVNLLGRDFECQIIRELVEEMLKDIHS